MKSFTFTIELSEEEVSSIFTYLVGKGNVSEDGEPHEAVLNYLRSLQEMIYNELANNAQVFATSKRLNLETSEVVFKEITGKVK